MMNITLTNHFNQFPAVNQQRQGRPIASPPQSLNLELGEMIEKCRSEIDAGKFGEECLSHLNAISSQLFPLTQDKNLSNAQLARQLLDFCEAQGFEKNEVARKFRLLALKHLNDEEASKTIRVREKKLLKDRLAYLDYPLMVEAANALIYLTSFISKHEMPVAEHPPFVEIADDVTTPHAFAGGNVESFGPTNPGPVSVLHEVSQAHQGDAFAIGGGASSSDTAALPDVDCSPPTGGTGSSGKTGLNDNGNMLFHTYGLPINPESPTEVNQTLFNPDKVIQDERELLFVDYNTDHCSDPKYDCSPPTGGTSTTGMIELIPYDNGTMLIRSDGLVYDPNDVNITVPYSQPVIAPAIGETPTSTGIGAVV